MSESNSLAKYNPQEDPDWQKIVNQIVAQMGEQMPDQVIQATEMLVAGFPTHDVAKRLGVKTTTVRRWLESYPAMAMAVANGRKLMSVWRMSRLEQQFLQAIDKSEEILDLDLEDRAVNSKLVGVVAQHARFIISLFAGQKIDVNIKVNQGEETLKAKQDALDYLALKLAAQREEDKPIEAVYRVLDANPEEAPTPLLSADGNPAFGQLGVLDTNEEGTLCHACGKRVPNLAGHVTGAHSLKLSVYEMIYMLTTGTLSEKKSDE